jgi:hypothetical protein
MRTVSSPRPLRIRSVVSCTLLPLRCKSHTISRAGTCGNICASAARRGQPAASASAACSGARGLAGREGLVGGGGAARGVAGEEPAQGEEGEEEEDDELGDVEGGVRGEI